MAEVVIVLIIIVIQGVSKLQGRIPHIERRKKKGYDDMGPEMYGYRVVRACIY
jgi:hypothetical protein